ncbi:sugar-binding transcriptional regulator [Paracoccus versutus]|uniref:DNA-binding transcriptional regulator LsrR (DeoR family) n=1 Tax=Paracoccus versutus TaxID=34007 RepID=A0A3D9XSB3_PARVE|nr:sugar-binding transcriptional regulator [Paracoccus versutus]REF73226.1 DNA-binding transcriptional regulator LsrR (DeoR family) [Paracoccus versutus]WGR54876.1 sugar-binding transcriptional regulator [Paracoccus versutus]
MLEGPLSQVQTPEVNENLRTRVAWLYHMEGLTQDEVAAKVGISRSRVLRILSNARHDGTVQIRVTTKLTRCVELERELETRWGLGQAIVVPNPQDEAQLRDIIGAEIGNFLSQNLSANMTIGLGWGKTLSAAVRAIVPRNPDGIRVLSLLGGLTRVSAQNPSEFAWRVAARLGAECHMMAGPVFAPDERTRDALAGHVGIRDIFSSARALDMAVISVGDLTPHSVFREYGLLSANELASLEAAGAIGDALCHFIDAEGKVVDHSVNRRVLAVHPDDLRSAKTLVLASGGWQKHAVIRAGLIRLQPQVLIVDEHVAERLIAGR